MTESSTDPARDLWLLIADQSAGMADDFITSASANAVKRLKRVDTVRAEIESTWMEAWKLLDAISNAMEQGSLHMWEWAKVQDDFSATRRALSLLQSAATMLVHEIVGSLKEGFLGAAISRWRALHEIAVTAIVLAQNGESVCRRYLDHGEVVRAIRLERHWSQAGASGPIQAERDALAQRAEALTLLHTLSDQSIPFHRSYAWATPLMEHRRDGKRLDPTFDRLESLAGLSANRIRVQDAHGFVHSDAAGLYRLLFPSATEMVLDRRASHIATVGHPLCDTIIQVTAATHMGFEQEMNRQAQILSMSAAGISELAARARSIFALGEPDRSVS